MSCLLIPPCPVDALPGRPVQWQRARYLLLPHERRLDLSWLLFGAVILARVVVHLLHRVSMQRITTDWRFHPIAPGRTCHSPAVMPIGRIYSCNSSHLRYRGACDDESCSALLAGDRMCDCTACRNLSAVQNRSTRTLVSRAFTLELQLHADSELQHRPCTHDRSYLAVKKSACGSWPSAETLEDQWCTFRRRVLRSGRGSQRRHLRDAVAAVGF
jgi:hypothetical protein